MAGGFLDNSPISGLRANASASIERPLSNRNVNFQGHGQVAIEQSHYKVTSFGQFSHGMPVAAFIEKEEDVDEGYE